jgi:hypothetical protein
MDAFQLNQIVQSSLERMHKKSELQKKKQQDYLKRLNASCLDFMEDLRLEIEERLLFAAQYGCKNTRFKSRFIFHNRYGNVKISTLIYGWMNHDGTWNNDGFKDIGFTDTPFVMLKNQFKSKGITINNISDPKKGFGFWIEAFY